MRITFIIIISLVFLPVLTNLAFAADILSHAVVDVPAYTVTVSGGYDHVSIPGGEIFREEEGRPEVPYYVKTVVYPAGYVVQNVVMTNRSGPRSETGLTLPPTVLNPDSASPPEIQAGVYPSVDFSWTAVENNDGASTLIIKVFPFVYDPGTRTSNFYSHYEFNIRYIYSNIRIDYMQTNCSVNYAGNDAVFDLLLRNAGMTTDVTVRAKIRKSGSDSVFSNLPQRSLKGLAGNASVQFIWDTSGVSPGSYCMDVSVADAQGNLYTSKTLDFVLLPSLAEFYIDKKHYKLGDVLCPMDVAPYIKSGRTYLPVRYIAYVCGIPDNDITWDGKTGTVTIKKGQYTLILKKGSLIITVWIGNYGFNVYCDAAPELKDNRMMLPIRHVVQSLGYSPPQWISSARTVRIDLRLP